MGRGLTVVGLAMLVIGANFAVADASGANRFFVWADGGEIMFKRSVNNGATWEPALNLSKNPGLSLTPQLATSGSNVYIVWNQWSSGNTLLSDIFFIRSIDNGATWGSKVKISTTGTNFFTIPELVVSGSKVYIAWDDTERPKDQDYFPLNVFVRASSDRGASWGDIVNLTDNEDNERLNFLSDMVAGSSSVFVLWESWGPEEFVPQVVVRRSIDAGQTFKPAVALDWLKDNFPIKESRIARSGSVVYVIYIAENEVVKLKRSTDNGLTWKPALPLSDGKSEAPQIAVAGAWAYITWSERGEVFFRSSSSNGGSWLNEMNLSTNTGYSGNRQIAALGSDVYLVWFQLNVDGSLKDILMRHSANNGISWSPKTKVSIAGDVEQFQPLDLALAGSSLFVAWQNEDEDVFMRRSIDSGTTWKPIINISANASSSKLPQVAN